MASELRTRFDDHLSRKFFHIVSGTIIAGLFLYVFPREWAMLILIVSGALFSAIDLGRLKIPALNRAVLKTMGPCLLYTSDAADE